MTLSTLIRKRSTGGVATAIHAIFATQPNVDGSTVARIATSPIANIKVENGSAPTVAKIAEVAVANRKAEKSTYPVADGPYTPYVVPMSPEVVTAIRDELVGLIDRLADLEGWHEARRTELVQTVHRQPLSSLRDDLHYFQARWQTHAVVQRVAEVGRNAVAKHDANRKCSTCEHRREWPYGVPVRCEVGRALPQAHHRWLVASDDLNPCREHTLKRDKT